MTHLRNIKFYSYEVVFAVCDKLSRQIMQDTCSTANSIE